MRCTLAAAVIVGLAAPAAAQRVPFERTFEVGAAPTVDVTTIRGAIDVSAGAPGRVVVRGTASVRLGFGVPADARALAEAVAKAPPIEQQGSALRLSPPPEGPARSALTVSYRLEVPPDTALVTATESGATTVGALAGRVAVRTQSAAIALRGTTGDVQVRTGSGAVEAWVAGRGAIDVETGSSAIDIRGAAGAVRTLTRSGHTTVRGEPAGAWDVSSGSGGITAQVAGAAPFRLDASTGSGSILLEGVEVAGSVAKDTVSGSVGAADGPTLRLRSRSGSIRISRPR